MAACPHCQATLDEGSRFCGACGKAATATESAPGGKSPFEQPDPYAQMIGRDIAGRFRIVAKLGEGGMGAVFRAEQTSLKRACAVKLLRPGMMANAQALARFKAEAAAVAKLSHQNTIDIYDYGQDTDGLLWIAMELVEGKSLREVIASEGPLSAGRALSIASQIAASLTDAHASSVIHRDLKPDNVMLTVRGKQRDIVKVLDFGIAKLRDPEAKGPAMTRAGDMLGTPQYMAPEQIRGEPIDGRTDVYALGCILYEMVTGRMPHEAESILAMLTKHLTEEVVAPSVRRPDIRMPPAVDPLVLGALKKDAAARPATMELFGEQIAAVFSHLPPDQRGATSSGFLPLVTPTGPTLPVGAPPVTPFGQPAPTPQPGPPSQIPMMQPFGASTLPPHMVRPQPATAAKGNMQMWITIGIAVAILGGICFYAFTHNGKDPENWFDGNKPKFDLPHPKPHLNFDDVEPAGSADGSSEGSDVDFQKQMDKLDKAVKDLDKLDKALDDN